MNKMKILTILLSMIVTSVQANDFDKCSKKVLNDLIQKGIKDYGSASAYVGASGNGANPEIEELCGKYKTKQNKTVIPQSSLSSNWFQVFENTTYQLFYDSARVVQTGNVDFNTTEIRVNILFNLNKPFQGAKSIKFDAGLICGWKFWRPVFMTYFSEKNMEGSKIIETYTGANNPVPLNWTPMGNIGNDSPIKYLYDKFCN